MSLVPLPDERHLPTKEVKRMISVFQQRRRTRRKDTFGTGALLLAILFAGGLHPALAQDSHGMHAQAEIGAAAKRFPPGSIKSVEAADKALAETSRERDAIQARYAQEEQKCNPKFFSSSCVEDANEARRQALRQVRSVEIEANKVKRQASVTARDAALAAKREKEGVTSLERDAAAREDTAGILPQASQPPQPVPSAQGAAPQRSAKPLPTGKPRDDNRIAEHEEKMRLIREKEASEEDKRAKNIAAYERKVKEAEERQKEVAKRKEEKARKLAEKKRAAEAGPK